MRKLESWEFNVFSFEIEELQKLVLTMFDKSGLLRAFGVSDELFASYITAVKDNYLDNPYHNFYHATEVLQFIYKLDHDKVFVDKLSDEERYALFLAALSHDIAHPGRNAVYHKTLLTELYERFGEESTLEKYHTEVALSLIDDLQYALLKKVKGDSLETFLSELVISTDITLHDQILRNIRSNKIKGSLKAAILAIKCADLGQLIRPIEISKKWGRLLDKEQYLQRSAQIEKGVNDGLSDREFELFQILQQEAFVNRYASPLFEELGKEFPKLQKLRGMLHEPFVR